MNKFSIDRARSFNDLAIALSASYDAYKSCYDNLTTKAFLTWTQKGESLMYPERFSEWEKLCSSENLECLDGGYAIEQTLEVMDALENFDTVGEAITFMTSNNHFGLFAPLVRRIVLCYSKKGPEFYEMTSFGNLTPEEVAEIASRKQENEVLAQQHSTMFR